jgi:fumarate hydratase class II
MYVTLCCAHKCLRGKSIQGRNAYLQQTKKYDTLAKNGQRFNQVVNICWEILREANPCVLAQNVKGARTQRREREGKILMRLSVMRNLNIIK